MHVTFCKDQEGDVNAHIFFGKSDVTKYLTTAGAQAGWIPSLLSSDAGCQQPQVPTPMPKGSLSVLEMAVRLYWSLKVK